MVKGNPKSSASSATRKKHAKKHAPVDEPPQEPGSKKPKGKGKKEPRVKMFIPPVKPLPVQPDPLETTGLAHSLPADLLVVLRNISKKAQVTKIRALEELQVGWVDKCVKDGEESDLVYSLVEMLPVWVSPYHFLAEVYVSERLVASSYFVPVCQPFTARATHRRNIAYILPTNPRREGTDHPLPSRNGFCVAN